MLVAALVTVLLLTRTSRDRLERIVSQARRPAGPRAG
jgi:hypothetical protein